MLGKWDEFFFDILSNYELPIDLFQIRFSDEHDQQIGIRHRRVVGLTGFNLPKAYRGHLCL